MPGRLPLPPPHPALKVSVVVPARNEEALIGSCLAAVVDQDGVSPEEYEVLLVLDRCTDETEVRAREIADSHSRFGLHLLDGPGKGSGHARRAGMELASARLLSFGQCLEEPWLSGVALSSPRALYRRASFAGTPS